MPRIGIVRLRKPDEELHAGSTNLGLFLIDICRLDPPHLIAFETPLDPVAKFGMAEKLGRAQNSASIIFPFMCAAAVYLVAWDKGIEVITVNRQTVLKHFTDKPRWGSREQAKAAVLSRARLLGYIPRESKDDDLADACAIFDYVSATHCRKPLQPKELIMFDERA